MILAREMQPEDYNNVITLWHDTSEMLLRDADSEQNIHRYLKHNPGLSFVLCDSAKIVGAILVGTDGRRGYVQHLAIASTHRGQGLGKQLLKCATVALQNQGIDKTHLFVNQDNATAQQFYQKLGWERREEVRMYSHNASSNHNV
ncbi:GNAT family N-acetyltransferase [Vibrio ulleungensis]|uniref:GNAT family N-acetyltransferase n=1 Tax=Vibrio ulleungensis TaxID=2807619 RepID=A0ABS2HH82_9VIBR|nr:GNAT family N-acetyltransferase [Vibrio ulleungensis]MBM7035528.1 GNAT family N-acetyltransferase [Vibrio ulleungensis]